jgi:hypothetical protein
MKAFLADYRLISTEELTRSEHELLEVLDYNILGPSVQDFMDAMLEALQGICTRNHSLGLNFVNLEPLVHWASEFVRLLENSFRLIRYPPSEKARAVINCAVAKLSVMYVRRSIDAIAYFSINLLILQVCADAIWRSRS